MLKPNAKFDRYQISMMADALEGHFGPEGDCSPESPCDIAATYMPLVKGVELVTVDPSRDAPPALPGARPVAGAPAANKYGRFTVHSATDAQMAFANRLVSERALPADAGLMTASLDQLAQGVISKTSISDLIDWLMDKPEIPSDNPTPPSDKQVKFARSLLSQKAHGFADEVVSAALANKNSTSALINELLAMGDKKVEIAVGMYRTADGTLYRAYPNQDRTRILAKKLVEVNGGWEFEYAGMASRFVTPEDRMSLEEAQAWGAQFGTCCMCAKLLTDPTSVSEGIGPVCKEKI